MSRTLEFVWLDVFAERPMEGNQLAVFPDARGLDEEKMQSIARETHISETTFVFPEGTATDHELGYNTRIFTVRGELPFAGHPTLGTASVIRDRTGRDEVALRLRAGRIPVTFSIRGNLPFGVMAQKEPTFGRIHEPVAVAKALGVSVDALDPSSPIQTVSTGVPVAIVPFRSVKAISEVSSNWSQIERYLADTDASLLYMITRETVDPAASVHARLIFSGGEDPATGSAAGPAVAWMVLNGWTKPDHSEVIEQGLEIHRPSILHASAGLRDGKPSDVRVGGHCIQVIRGQLML